MSSSTGAVSRVLSPTSIASSFQYVTASDRHSEVPTSSDESFGSISDETSSDDDEMDTEPTAFDVQKLPTVAKDDATVKKKLEKAKRNPVRRTCHPHLADP